MTRIALPLLIFALLSTACSHTAPKPLPKEAYQCAAWPNPPKGEYGWREVADYIVRGKSAYLDCRAKLNAVK